VGREELRWLFYTDLGHDRTYRFAEPGDRFFGLKYVDDAKAALGTWWIPMMSICDLLRDVNTAEYGPAGIASTHCTWARGRPLQTHGSTNRTSVD
jgi:hypothetical protein